MSCNCELCQQHAKTLGLESGPASKDAIHRAYRDAAKQWHPDRFESAPHQRPEAEEHFKQVQIAYRALTEHQQNPAQLPSAALFAKPARPVPPAKPMQPGASARRSAAAQAKAPEAPNPLAPFSFANLPGCFTGPHFPPFVQQVIDAHLGREHTALAVVDLTRADAPSGELSQFMLLASHGVLLRDILNMASLIWYSDLGEITMVDQRRNGKLGLWQRLLEKIAGNQYKYALRIHRRNGAHFCTLAGQADDSVKKVIYNFLLRRKYETQP